jgi:four helix bundle protein
MKEANPILEMSYRFALEVMAAAKAMRNRKEYDLASQFWRAGTSIGANVEEAQAAQSRADFKSKMAIAAKEARESGYWLRLARDGGILAKEHSESLLQQVESIQKILTSIVKTTSEKP